MRRTRSVCDDAAAFEGGGWGRRRRETGEGTAARRDQKYLCINCRFFHVGGLFVRTNTTGNSISVPAGFAGSFLNTNLRAKAVKVPGQESNHHGGERCGRKVSRGSRGARIAREHLASRAPRAVPGPRSPNAQTRRHPRGPRGPARHGKWGRPQLQRPRRAHEGAPGEGELGHERGGGRRDRARAGHRRGHTRRRRRPSDA